LNVALTDLVHDPLDDGKSIARLEQFTASDLMVVNAARVSFGDRNDELDEAGQKLIAFLLKHRHGTPFEHNMFTYHIRCPIFVAREWMRHRIGSYNEFSARYKEMPQDFYVPHLEDIRTQVGKPGHYTFEPMEETQGRVVQENIKSANRIAWNAYISNIKMGCAKEVARLSLPVNIYTEFYWTVNARALMNFLSLRNAETAQREIRYFAEVVELLFSAAMPVTHSAFVSNDRVAP